MVHCAANSVGLSSTTRTQRGFTLVELLVVIAIIAILIGITVVIAGHVAGNGKRHKTEDTLRLLDSALASYTNAKGGIPPPTVLDPRNPVNATTKYIIPIIDGRNFTSPLANGDFAYMNSVGLFMLQCKEVSEADAMLKGVDAKIIHEYDADVTDTTTPNFEQQPTLATAFDGWGHPIRYVHPALKGVVIDPTSASDPQPSKPEAILGSPPPGKQYGIRLIRRLTDYNGGKEPLPPIQPLYANGKPFDADCGVPPDNRPYFYSAGPDGDPYTVEDNIYTTRPKFLKK